MNDVSRAINKLAKLQQLTFNEFEIQFLQSVDDLFEADDVNLSKIESLELDILPNYKEPDRLSKDSNLHWILVFIKYSNHHAAPEFSVSPIPRKQQKTAVEFALFAIYLSIKAMGNGNQQRQASNILTRIKGYLYTNSLNNLWVWQDRRFIVSKLLQQNYQFRYLNKIIIDIKKETNRHLSNKDKKTRINQIKNLNQTINWIYHPKLKFSKARIIQANTESHEHEINYGMTFTFNDDVESFDEFNTNDFEQFFNENQTTFFVDSVTNDTENYSSDDQIIDNDSIEYFFVKTDDDIEQLDERSTEDTNFKVDNTPIESLSVYASSRSFGLMTDVRKLSLTSYQSLFSHLHQRYTLEPSYAICYLSLITGLPIESLIHSEFIKKSGLFEVTANSASIVFKIGVSKRVDSNHDTDFLNESDIISLPLPYDLIQYILSADFDYPTHEDISDCLKTIRKDLDIVYLSKARIKTALHTLLRRYVEGGNKHYADIICRIPAEFSPAQFYSSHNLADIQRVYKKAIQTFDNFDEVDINYLNLTESKSIGSLQVLKTEYVRQLLEKLFNNIMQSASLTNLINNYNLYLWYILCLLTGIRPNSGVPCDFSDIDLETGWMIVDDKRTRVTQTHRLIPLCETVIKAIKNYLCFINHVRLLHLHDEVISSKFNYIFEMNAEHKVLNFISENYQHQIIHRSEIKALTNLDIDISPYWTRHYFRTQLEFLKVDNLLINSVIGHESYQQESLNAFSSISKRQIHNVRLDIEKIAEELQVQTEINYMDVLRRLTFKG